MMHTDTFLKYLRRSIPILFFLIWNVHAVVFVPKAPKIPVKSYILMEVNTGKIIANHEENKKIQPASITKLMTAYSVFEALENGQISLNDPVRISQRASSIGGSTMFLDPSMKVSVEELLQGMIIISGNDASIALAEHTGGSEDAFVEFMNVYAESLGLKNTQYKNSTGLDDEGHYSSALDIALLATEIIEKYPEHFQWYSQRSFTFDKAKDPLTNEPIIQYNRNKLLQRDSTVDGMKTGYTSSAGYCLVATAEKNTMRLIAVVTGANSDVERTDSTAALLNYGFRFFETTTIVDSKMSYAEAKVWKGETDTVQLGVKSDFIRTIPKGSVRSFETTVTVYSPVNAPVDTSQIVGKMTITSGKDTIIETPLYPMNSVKKGSLWQRIYDSVLLLFE